VCTDPSIDDWRQRPEEEGDSSMNDRPMTITVHPAAPVRIAHYAPASSWGPWPMTDYEVVWLLSGSALRTVEDVVDGAPRCQTMRLEPGSILISRPGTRESYDWDHERHSTHAWVHFDAELPGDYPASDSWPLVRRLDDHVMLQGIAEYLLDLVAAGPELMPSRADQMLALLVDLYVRGPLPQRSAGLPSARIVLFAETVRATWARDGVRIISVEEIAQAMGISREHLSREFGLVMRVGVSRALELLRLGQAAVALQRTNQTVEHIASTLGFASPYHFTRRFAWAYGAPPGRFRALGLDQDPLAPVRLAGLTALWDAILRAQ
jgi:AraC-like DNA-binding protein